MPLQALAVAHPVLAFDAIDIALVDAAGPEGCLAHHDRAFEQLPLGKREIEMQNLSAAAAGVYFADTIDEHMGWVFQVGFSPDGKLLATASRDNTMKLWDVRTRQQVGELRGHKLAVDTFAFAPDGRTLATGSYDNTIKLWDVASNSELRTLRGHEGFVLSVAFAPDGRRLASGGTDARVRAAKQAALQALPAGHPEPAVTASDAERLLVTGGGTVTEVGTRELDGHVVAWTVTAGGTDMEESRT